MLTPPASTAPPRGWRIVDPVVRLRALESDELYPLPDPRERGEVVLAHAHVAWDGERWRVLDLGGERGLWIDGVRRQWAVLAPGVEIGLGGLTLLAESAELLALRALVARLIGWSGEQRREVDRALRGLRDAALPRAALVLCGDGELAPIARRLHRETLGAERPFVACGRRDRALELLRRAGDGTLCVSALEPPGDLPDALAALRAAASPARLVLCAPDARDAAPLAIRLGPTAWIELPPLIGRRAELPRILVEAADDAAGELAQPFAPLRTGDIERLASEPFEDLADLHDAARRLVALRVLGLSAGAAHLGASAGALSRWARRRGLAA